MKRPTCVLALLLATSTVASAQPGNLGVRPISPEVADATRKVVAEIDRGSELMLNLEYLCDVIGPRLTGSPNLKRANEWTRDKFREYGLADAHLEGWKIARSWTRGPASGRVVAPTEQRLIVESAGWSPSTSGPLKGKVVYLKGEQPADLDAFKGKIRGAWVITGPVSVQPSPKTGKVESPYSSAPNRPVIDFAKMRAFRKAQREFIEKEGAAGILRDSDKEHGLVNMTGSSDDFTASKLPEAFLTTESYGLVWRLLKRGPVEVEVDLRNTLSDGPVEVYNTVAELPGTDRQDEVVIIGGHLDSWDLGTGATDNGTGTMAVLEAARALKVSGLKPRRTIRFVLFSGEEEGLHGSKEYAKAHAAALDKVSAVMVHDMGTGRVKSVGLQGRYDLREVMDRVVAPFQRDLGLEEMSLRNMGGTDHLSFLPAGVPAFAVVQDEAEYRKTHHTESDTYDKVYPDEVNQGAKVLAAWAYNVAMLPDLLPRDPKAAKPSSPSSEPAPKPKDAVGTSGGH